LTFITCDYFAKPSSLFFYDLIDAVFFTLTALGISLFTHEIRITSIENYLKLEKTAEEDLLTGLYNRGTGVKKLTEIVNNKTPGLFVMADLDDFKKVNDTYGHMAGDEALRLFSSKLKTLFSKDGTIIMRFGGDEFAFWIQSSLTYEQTKELLSMAISEIDKLKLKDHPEYEMHISIGCTISDGKNIEDFNQLYAVTDKALYRAKREGKHQYVIEGYGK
jgi:diguanylate cyclase (GGDEF)-like protein